MNEGRIKRFYHSVGVKPDREGYAAQLDGRPARTKSGKLLSASTKALAEAVAAEWSAQGDTIDHRTMPLTGLLSAAIDGGEEAAADWRAEILNYLGTDLLCYRADRPQALTELQAAVWDPYLDWLRREFGAALVTTRGVAAIGQPGAAVEAVRRRLEGQSTPMLLGLRTAAAIAGSAVLALALWKQAFPAEEIFNASRLDEHFQEKQWGVDLEAEAREEAMRREFLCVARFLALLEE